MNQTNRRRMINWILFLSVVGVLVMYWYSDRWARSTADHPVFVDKNGKVAINIFREGQDGGMQSFSEGLAAYYVETEDRRSNLVRRLELGYIDRTGRAVIRRVDTDGSKFDLGEHGGFFSEGRATFPQGGKWGYIGRNGRWVAKPQFDEAYDYKNGMARVEIDGKTGYLDKQGKLIIKPTFVSGAIHRVHVPPTKEDEDKGEERQTYKIIEGSRDFSEDRAVVRLGEKFAFIDKMGKLVTRPIMDVARGFSEGLAAVKIGGKWGYVDKSGKIRIPLQFTDAGDFSMGLTAVKAEDKWGFIDKNGTFVIPPRYDKVLSFWEGLASVTIGGKTGYIDKTGATVIKPQFTSGGYFSEGVAVISVGSKKGFVDKLGRVTFVPGVDNIQNFYDGTAVVMRERGKYCGYIDKRGKFVVKMENRTASNFSEGLGLVWPYSGTTLAKDDRR